MEGMADIEARARQRDIAREEAEEEAARAVARKNRGFVQVYPKGWKLIQTLMRDGVQACRLFAFFCEHIDSQCGAVVASQDFLARRMGVEVRTIQRWLKTLETDHKAIVRIRIQGGVYAYAVSEEMVWRGYETSKPYAAFNTKTLIDKNGEVVKKLKLMMLQQQIELPLEEEVAECIS